MAQEMCPICNAAFEPKDVVVKYWRWAKSGRPKAPKLAHVGCLQYLSVLESREQPEPAKAAKPTRARPTRKRN